MNKWLRCRDWRGRWLRPAVTPVDSVFLKANTSIINKQTPLNYTAGHSKHHWESHIAKYVNVGNVTSALTINCDGSCNPNNIVEVSKKNHPEISKPQVKSQQKKKD